MFAYCLCNPVNSYDPDGEFAIGTILGKAAIGAGINVLTTFVAAKVTGQDYTWKDAGVAALSGAIGSGNATKLKVIAGVVSGVYTGAMAYKNGASLDGALAAGVVSGVGTTFAVSNIAQWLKAPLGPVAAPVVDLIFGTSANTMAAVTYKVAVDSSKTNELASNTAQRSTTSRLLR